MTKNTKKTHGREFALKFLFQFFIKENNQLRQDVLDGKLSSEDLEEKVQEFKISYLDNDDEHPNNNINSENFIFAYRLIKEVSKNMNYLERTIQNEIKRENLDSIDKIERSALLAGLAEIFYFNTPHPVILNEYIEITKKYGAASSSKFVNGVLDGIRAKK